MAVHFGARDQFVIQESKLVYNLATNKRQYQNKNIKYFESIFLSHIRIEVTRRRGRRRKKLLDDLGDR
jgi:hypothetical protein